MGQKTHPIGFRLGVIRLELEVVPEKDYAKWLHEDMRLKKFVKEKLEPRRRLAASRSSAPPTR